MGKNATFSDDIPGGNGLEVRHLTSFNNKAAYYKK